MRLIDADALKEELAKRTPHFAQRIKFTPCFEAIRDAPTVDAVPVVRCEQCIHNHYCTWSEPGWFCADGERKSNEDK